MAFDIATLTEMGITPEAAEKLVCLHNGVVDGVKEQLKQAQEEVEAAKTDAEQAAELQARIDELKAGEDGYKAKYEAEKEVLADLIKLRNEMRKDELMEAVLKSEHSYTEIMAFIKGETEE